MSNFKTMPGTQDILPGVVEKWQFVEQTARELCRQYNFREIRTPIFEATELFQRGVGETTDIVEKEMYTFTDRGDRSNTLRPEGTAGVVRSYVQNKMYGEPDINKLYYVGPMFRYERAQAGRYRQFHQFGVEAIGSTDPALDAEVIALGYSIYTQIGLKNVRVELNSVGTPSVRQAFREKLLTFLNPMRETLCKDCQNRIDKNPLRVLDCKVDQDKFADAPSILDSLDEECQTHFDLVKAYLTDMNIPFEINHRLVRGLDYYTHTAFEYKAEGIGAIDTIGGGGRYNGLVSDIGGPDQPGVGFGLGLERAVLILEHQQVEVPNLNALDVYVIALGDEAKRPVNKLVYELRQAGVKAEQDYQNRKLKAQMKSADRLNVKYTAIVGEDELANESVMLKEMATGEQKLVKFSELAAELLNSRA